MKHISLFESWANDIQSKFPLKNPWAKKSGEPEETPKDMFIELGMQDPTDPKSSYERTGWTVQGQAIKKGIPKILDVSKYYYYDSQYVGGWLVQFVYVLLWDSLKKLEKFKIGSEWIHGVDFYGNELENVWATKFFPTGDENEEPIVILISAFGKIYQAWIPKTLLESHFKTPESAEAYLNEIDKFITVAKKADDFGFFKD
jgi:hypothetical protein